MKKCWSEKVENRPTTVYVLEELEKYLQGEHV